MASEFKIESGIQVPDRIRGPGAQSKYPFREMKVGDSFLVPGVYSEKLRLRAANAAYVAGKRSGNGHCFTARKVKGGVRVWRIA